MYKLLILIILPILLSAEKCNIDTKVMYSILLNESYSKKTVGYQYLISFNNESDAKIARNSKLKRFFLNKRTIDCKNTQVCVNMLKQLKNAKITNLDLGPYQINFRHHKLELSHYFNLKQSYLYACSYVNDMIDKHGYNWYAIASYHSQTPYYNKRYKDKLIQNYKTIKDKDN
jgi:type VI protein secretion system component Hcp